MWRQVSRLAKPAVPARLTDLVPEWLAAAARLRRTPVPWAQMLRAGVAICVPLSAGIAVGQRALGLLTAMGGLLGVVVDNGGPFAARFRRVGSAAFGGVVGLVISSLLYGRGWVAVLGLVVVAGVAALLSAVSAIGSVTGLQLMIYAALGLGPLGALRPWWHTALGVLLGVAWALILTVPGWLLSPRAAEQHSVAAVYRALAGELRAIGTAGSSQARRSVTAALNAAYDTLFTARSTAGGRSRRLMRLMALLNQGNLIAEATTALSLEGAQLPSSVISAVDRLAAAIGDKAVQPVIPLLEGTSPGMRALRDGLDGLARILSGNWAPTDAPQMPRPSLRERLGALGDRLNGRLTWIFTIRLMVCVGVAAVISEVLPLQRSYWVVLTVVIVLKPDFGSVFTRAVQRGIGTVIGAVLGAAIIAVVPYGPWLLLPFAVLATLLPYGRSRNYGLMAVFLTPLVVVLIDLIASAGWRLAEDRLLDTLLGCGIVLSIGYAPWPTSWQAHLPGRFAAAIRNVCRYMQEALVTAPAAQPPAAEPHPAGSPTRARLRRQAFRALSDLRAEFERTMAEPQAVSRRATAWWPAVVGLEEVAEAVIAATVAISHGASAPSPRAVRQLAAALGAVADAVQAGAAPCEISELPSDQALKPVTEAVRAVLAVLVSPKQPSAAGRDPPSTTGAPRETRAVSQRGQCARFRS
ncbi:MAG: FUSC family protein [Streptosporangiaceae bacterium]